MSSNGRYRLPPGQLVEHCHIGSLRETFDLLVLNHTASEYSTLPYNLGSQGDYTTRLSGALQLYVFYLSLLWTIPLPGQSRGR